MEGTQKFETALTKIKDKFGDIIVEFKKQKQEDPDRNKVPCPKTEPEFKFKSEPDEFDSVFDEAIKLKESALPDLIYLSKIIKVTNRLTKVSPRITS